MAFQGNSKTVNVPDLLGFVLQHRLTGVLVLTSRLEERCFYFRKGEIAYAVAQESRLLLGERVVQELDVDRAAVERVIDGLEGDAYLGEELVRQEVVSRDDLNDVLIRQVRRSLREVLQWPDWAFYFHKLHAPECLPRLRQCTRSLVIDLIRELDEWNSLQEIFPNLDHCVERKPGSVRSARPGKWPASLPAPGRILLQVDTRRSIRQLLEESAYPVRDYAQGLSQLVQAEALQIVEEPLSVDAEASYPLPLMPTLAARILALVDAGPTSLETLYEVVLLDPVLTARTLRIAGIRGRRRLDGPLAMRHLLTRIGRSTLETILIAEAIRGLYLFPGSAAVFQEWAETYVASCASRRLAELAGFRDPELAQVAGLVQNLGSLVLAAEHGDDYRKVCEESLHDPEGPLRLEQEKFGTHHALVGSQLADRWCFPVDLKTVIREHHSNLEHPQNQLLAIVRLANRLARSRKEPRYSPTKLERRLLRRLRLSVGDLLEIRSAVIHSGEDLESVGEREYQAV